MKTRVVTGGRGVKLSSVTRQLLSEPGGVANFFRGIKPAVIGVVPFAGVDLALYNILRDVVAERRHLHSANDLGIFATLCIGATSSSVAQMVSFPLSVVRTRLQASHADNGMLDCFQKVWKSSGIRGLYRGLVPSLAKGLPSSVIGYVVFEQTKKWLRLH